MIEILDYESEFIELLPETHMLLKSGGLTALPGVSKITLHGSRGPGGGCRPGSDIDLALHVRTEDLPNESKMNEYLKGMLVATLENWSGSVELDIAIVFDRHGCDLKCFGSSEWTDVLCETQGVDCLGIYKIQKGFDGFVTGPASQVQLMYPFLTIWQS